MKKVVTFGDGRTVTFRRAKALNYDSPERTARRVQKRAAKRVAQRGA